MKKFLFVIAVVALLASCVAGGADVDCVGGEKSLTISLPTTRTHIGEEANDGYPVYWSEGDRIALNGACSHEAEIDVENKSLAVFAFDAVLSYPYALTYPYTDATNEERAVVEFPAVQNYVENGTESGILPMYGYVTDKGAQVRLNHLASVLRFVVNSSVDGVKLSKVVITSSSAKLAGEFVVDCTNGSLTPTTGATNSVTYNLPADFALSTSTESIFYIALPAGESGACTIELVEQSGAKMTASWSEKNLAAGIVRKFKTLTYKRGDRCTLEPFGTEYDEIDDHRSVAGYVKDSAGNPIAGVAVSDGFSITTTNVNGHYKLTPSTDAWYIYVTVPSGYQIDTNEKNLPCFYQKYDPKKQVYNFTLTPLAGGVEAKFALVAITDVHIDYDRSGENLFANSVVPHINKQYDSLTGAGVPCYGINLGDYLTHLSNYDGSEFRDDFLASLQGSKVKFFSIFGNHDFDYFNASKPLTTDARNSTFNLKAQREHEEMFGPVNYSFDRGNAHIIGMRNTQFTKNNNNYSTAYEYGFTDEQVEWLRQDLALVPKDKAIIYCIHVPLFNSTYTNYDKVRALLNEFETIYILSGHNHYNRNIRHKSFSAYKTSKLVEYNTCSVSGPVWKHTIAGDGSPQGYRVFICENNRLSHNYYLGWQENEGKNLLENSKQMRLYWGDAKFGAPAGSNNPNGTKGYYAFNFSNANGKKTLLANVYNAGYDDWSIRVYENGVDMGEMTKLTYERPKYEELVGDGSFSNPFRAADGVVTGHDFYVEGYMLGKDGRAKNDDGILQACFHMYSYTLKDNSAKVKVVATDPYGDKYTEEVILGDTTF